jgi:hypothetical protein
MLDFIHNQTKWYTDMTKKIAHVRFETEQLKWSDEKYIYSDIHYDYYYQTSWWYKTWRISGRFKIFYTLTIPKGFQKCDGRELKFKCKTQ